MKPSRIGRIVLLVMLSVLLTIAPVRTGHAEEPKVDPVLLVEITTEKGPLKLREKPSKQGKVLCEIPKGTVVEANVYDDTWYAVTYDDQQGYVMSAYTTVLENADPEILNYTTLQNGDSGEDVLTCKQRLMALGYYRADSTFNNKFNTTMTERVRLFQRVNGLTEDGIATSKLLALLYSDDALTNTEPLPAAQSATHYGSSGSSTESDDGWHQEVCSCCSGRGCVCCDYIGTVWVPD